MFEGILNFFRQRALKKYSSDVPTSILPVGEIHSAVAFIDVEDTSFDACKAALQAFFRDNGIKGDIFFFDFRKIGKEERLITSITTTILRRDLNFYGKPAQEKVNLMLGADADLFISLIRGSDFPIEFMAKCSRARFKIGRQQLPGDTFDMVVSEPEDKVFSQEEVFSGIRDYLKFIEK